jgi:hypothetical protein
MLRFFSFCCFIDKISKEDLIFALKLLVSSLDYYVKSYELIIYTNFDIDMNHKNIIIKNYYDNKNIKYCDGDTPFDRWFNLSFNKMNIYKDLYDEYNENYIWIDLDTPVMSDISYLENVDNFFIEVGGNRNDPFTIVHNHFDIDTCKTIQGSTWKLNIQLYNSLMETLNELNNQNLKIAYDFQGLVAYYLYGKLNGQMSEQGINVLGLNYQMNTINGLCIWTDYINNNNDYCNIYGLQNLYYENGVLKTNFHPNKEIHFLTCTFISLNEIKHTELFKELFNHLLTF